MVVTIMSSGCVSKEREREAEENEDARTRGRKDEELGRARARWAKGALDGEGRRAGKGGKGECGKTCSLSLHPFPPTDHPAAAARSKRGGRGDGGGGGGEGRKGRTGGGEQEEKGNSGERSREVWRSERGCRTPIRSIAAYSPYTFAP